MRKISPAIILCSQTAYCKRSVIWGELEWNLLH